MRVVIDTNILVSYAIRPSRDFARLFQYVRDNGTSLVCEETLAELVEVLCRDKFDRYFPRKGDIREYIEAYEGVSESVELNEHIIACRDPKDDKFLSLAVSGRADCIVASDKHLKEMIEFRGIPILSPAQFLNIYVS